MSVEFVVVDDYLKAILGLKTCKSIKLICRIAAVTQKERHDKKKIENMLLILVRFLEEKLRNLLKGLVNVSMIWVLLTMSII